MKVSSAALRQRSRREKARRSGLSYVSVMIPSSRRKELKTLAHQWTEDHARSSLERSDLQQGADQVLASHLPGNFEKLSNKVIPEGVRAPLDELDNHVDESTISCQGS